MKKTFLIISYIALSSLTSFALSQDAENYTISKNDFKKYIELNHLEKRLIDYKDDEKSLSLKLQQLAHINHSRIKHQQKTVELDILASRVANKIAEQSAKGNFMGHYNTQGESPYLRFALAGGTDHIMENASAISSTQNLLNTDAAISKYMQQLHNAFMAEKKPNDGHKQNCIHPNHNYVGIGFYLHKNQFRYYEEFIDRYLDVHEIPTNITLNQKINIKTKALNNKQIYMILVYYEKHPSKMSTTSINRRKTYDDYTKELTHQILPWDLPKPEDNGYTNLEFTFLKKGVYYVQIFMDDKPYTQGKASTKNKIQASGIVISVN